MTALPAKGERLPSLTIAEITQAQIEAYLAVSGDDNSFHTSAELARQIGFERIPVPGMLVMAQVARCVQQWPRTGAVTKLITQFFAPVLVGGDLQIEARVVAADAAANAATLRITAAQAGKVVVMAEAAVILRD